MERILVSIDGRANEMAALERGLWLARRIKGHLYVLLVQPPSADTSAAEKPQGANINVDALVRQKVGMGRAEGIPISYFVTEGQYPAEVLKFSQQHGVTRWIAAAPSASTRNRAQAWLEIHQIRHQIGCPVEVIQVRHSVDPTSKGE